MSQSDQWYHMRKCPIGIYYILASSIVIRQQAEQTLEMLQSDLNLASNNLLRSLGKHLSQPINSWPIYLPSHYLNSSSSISRISSLEWSKHLQV